MATSELDELAPFNPHSVDYSDLENQFTVPQEQGWQNIIILDQLPKVDAQKKEKLVAVLMKNLVSKASAQLSDKPVGGEALFMPMGEDGLSKGFMFLQLQTPEQADAVRNLADNYRLDKSHVLSAYRFDDVERLLQVPDKMAEPKLPPFQPREHLRSWLLDPQGRDQFVSLQGDLVSVFFNTNSDQPELVQQRQHWTESYVQWSPQGAYLASLHRQGVALWGGPQFVKWMRFSHPGVRLVDFSPCESFLVTWSPPEPSANPANPAHNLIVWDAKTGALLRGFNHAAKQVEWPVMKWSHDERYFAKLGEDMIQVYETPSMALVDKKSLKVEQVQSFAWSPTETLLAYWQPEQGSQPARVCVMEWPTRQVLRAKNLFHVAECKLIWQNKGDFLLVQVERTSKNKKSTGTTFELFRIRDKQMPVETHECGSAMAGSGSSQVAFEPFGDRFVCLLPGTEGRASQVMLFDVKQGIKQLHVMERKNVNRLFWSPAGRFLAMAQLEQGSHPGFLEFWDMQETTPSLMGAAEHFTMTDVCWDPSGRYLCTVVSQFRTNIENGYMIWNLKGDCLAKQHLDRFKQFIWRPRPPLLLSSEQQKAIKKDLKKYSQQFDEQDARQSTRVSAAVVERRRQLLHEWQQWHRSASEKLKEWALPTLVPASDNAATETIVLWTEELELIETVLDSVDAA